MTVVSPPFSGAGILAERGAADQRGVFESGRIAQLGVEHDGQVPHRDHPGRPPGRRHDEGGPVHHVAAADEPLDRRAAGKTRMAISERLATRIFVIGKMLAPRPGRGRSRHD
ncbi:hypothetical protein B4Q13_18160 [Lacticaseibacillus rhamnosus]